MKKRTVIIYHPDFDKEGAPGVKAAKDMVEQFMDGNQAILAEVKKKGVTQDELAKFEQWIAQLQYFIRRIEV
jgi:protein tyrosine phosphatase (PTP) superfamily phosphohydrolase (DUF442 family)